MVAKAPVASPFLLHSRQRMKASQLALTRDEGFLALPRRLVLEGRFVHVREFINAAWRSKVKLA